MLRLVILEVLEVEDLEQNMDQDQLKQVDQEIVHQLVHHKEIMVDQDSVVLHVLVKVVEVVEQEL